MNSFNLPLLQSLLALLTGVLLQKSFGNLELSTLIMIGFIWLFIVIIFFICQRHNLFFSTTVIIGYVWLGFLLCQLSTPFENFENVNEVYLEGIIKDPVEWQESQFSFDNEPKYYSSFNLKLKRYSTADGLIAETSQKIRCTLISCNDLKLKYGDQIGVTGTIKAYQAITNPGEFDLKNYYLNQGVRYKLKADKGWLVWRKTDNLLAKFKQKLETLRQDWATLFFAMPGYENEGKLLQRILLGIRKPLPIELRENFTKTNTFHIIAISGMHIGIIWSAGWLIVYALGVPGKFRSIVLMPLIVCYAMMVGFRPSVIRAVLMFSFISVAPLIGRKNYIFNTLILVAFIFFLFYPMQLFSLGPILSFGSVLTMVLLLPSLNKYLNRFSWLNRVEAYDLEHQNNFLGPIVVRYFINIVCGTLLIWLTLWPITACNQNIITFLGPLANIVLIPFTAFILYNGFLTGAVALVCQPLALWINKGSLIVVKGMLAYIAKLSQMNWAYNYIKSLTGSQLFWYYSTLFLLFILFYQKFVSTNKTINRKLGLAMLFSLLIFTGLIVSDIVAEKPFKIVSLDVGLGDSNVIQTPAGQTILIDAGVSFGDWSKGSRVVAPYLRSQGIDRIDAAFCSHFDRDHVGGYFDLIKLIPIDKMYGPVQIKTGKMAQALKSLAKEYEIDWQDLSTGTTLTWDQLTFEVLHPPALITNWYEADTELSDNSWSLVLLGEYAGKKFIFNGDADLIAEAVQINAGADLDIDYLKVGHHGSKSSSSAEYLSYTRPKVASIGVGPNNFDLPSQEVLTRLDQVGAQVFRTDIDGAIEYLFDQDFIKVRVFNKKSEKECTK